MIWGIEHLGLRYRGVGDKEKKDVWMRIAMRSLMTP